jgi:hypothetical protein
MAAFVDGGCVCGDRVWFTEEQWFVLVHTLPPPGLGDRVAGVFKPIAGAIDSVLGTDLVNCGDCGQRQEALNHAFPVDSTAVQ